MAKMRNPISLPAGGASQANVDKSLSQATDEIKEVVYKSVAGLEVELNKTASATANGTLVVEPSDGKDVMEKATVTVAIPLEDNKAATIDVSQYASAVEVTPTDGKTAMKKTTVTLSNIPVLEANKAATIDVSQYSEAVEVTPSSNKDAMEKVTVTLTNIPDIEANKEASITQNGTVEITPSSGKDAMAKTTVTVNVSGGGADLEDNKEATIDVSVYTDPVEVTPTQGKDGMKKVTVSLSNMPAGANMLYAWTGPSTGLVFFNFDTAPQDASALYETFWLRANVDEEELQSLVISHPGTVDSFTRTSDTEFTISVSQDNVTFTRDATKDVEIWNAPPSVETTKQATIDVSTYDPANKPVITPTADKQSMGSVEVTLDNVPQIEANKSQTIDVSQYTEPVEITPTSGKNGMAKATVTLSNIPSGGGTAYAWNMGTQADPRYLYFNFDTSPNSAEEFNASKVIRLNKTLGSIRVEDSSELEAISFTRVSNTEFTANIEGDMTFTRDTTLDFTLW